MTTIELTDDEFNTLHEAFNDVGCDCPGVDWDKFKALGVKFGFWEAEKPPTEEELKRAEEWRNSPSGKLMSDLMKQSNEMSINMAYEYVKDVSFMNGPEWEWSKDTFGFVLRTRLPNDYQIKDTPIYINKIKDNK